MQLNEVPKCILGAQLIKNLGQVGKKLCLNENAPENSFYDVRE